MDNFKKKLETKIEQRKAYSQLVESFKKIRTSFENLDQLYINRDKRRKNYHLNNPSYQEQLDSAKQEFNNYTKLLEQFKNIVLEEDYKNLVKFKNNTQEYIEKYEKGKPSFATYEELYKILNENYDYKIFEKCLNICNFKIKNKNIDNTDVITKYKVFLKQAILNEFNNNNNGFFIYSFIKTKDIEISHNLIEYGYSLDEICAIVENNSPVNYNKKFNNILALTKIEELKRNIDKEIKHYEILGEIFNAFDKSYLILEKTAKVFKKANYKKYIVQLEDSVKELNDLIILKKSNIDYNTLMVFKEMLNIIVVFLEKSKNKETKVLNVDNKLSIFINDKEIIKKLEAFKRCEKLYSFILKTGFKKPRFDSYSCHFEEYSYCVGQMILKELCNNPNLFLLDEYFSVIDFLKKKENEIIHDRYIKRGFSKYHEKIISFKSPIAILQKSPEKYAKSIFGIS